MKTNRIMDEIRSTISPEMKQQMEIETEVSRWLSGTHNLTLSTICKISTALGEDIVTVPKMVLEPDMA